MSKYAILNFSLLLAIVALVAFIIYDPSESRIPKATPLTSINPASIDTITIEQREKSKITLKKRQTIDSNEYWAITHPITITASTQKMNRLMDVLAAGSIRQYNIAQEQYSKFGLAPPQWQLQFNQQTIKLGNTDAINQYRYVLINEKVHLITDRYTHQLSDLPLSLASLELLPDNKDIREIQTPSLTLTQTNGRWQFTAVRPDDSTATTATKIDSQDTINAFIDEWRHAQALRLSFTPESTQQKTAAQDADTQFPQNINEQQQVIILTGEKRGITRFVIQRDNDNVKLIRQDLGIAYHLSNNAKERLLNPPLHPESLHEQPDK